MTTEAFVRRPRLTPPSVPGGEVPLNAPPEVPRPVPPNLISKIMPVIMIVAVLGMLALFFTMGSAMMRSPFMLMFPLMMMISMGAMLMNGRGNGPRPAELDENRKDYLRYLNRTRAEVLETGAAQRRAGQWSHPEPGALMTSVGSRRMWERRPKDADFAHVRVGVGSQHLVTRLQKPETGPIEDLEPVSTVALRRFVRTHSVVHALPIAINLRSFPAINVEGERERTRTLVRAMIAQLCTFHGPDHLRIAVITSRPNGGAWDWAKWLPHLGHPAHLDGVGAERMLYHSLAGFEHELDDVLGDRGRFVRNNPQPVDGEHFVVVIDDGTVEGTEQLVGDVGLDGVTVIDLNAPQTGLAVRRGLQLVVDGDAVAARSSAGVEEFATVDRYSVPEAEALAKAIGRYHVASAAQIIDLDAAGPTDKGLMALLGVKDAGRITPEQVWKPRSARDRLRVPVGTTPDGRPVEIDIKEAAENGMGPHGLCVGATGSGKSEFLRTLVLSMITTHPPEALNLILVDFKGGATFLGLEQLPHVSAVITNLEDEIALVDRMMDALRGEMTRRQELLRSAGNFANVGDYEKARAAGAPLDPLPALFIVVDEFSELLSQKPEFAELFVAIGRLGRSLQMHLLLASQRLEEGKLRGLDSHLSYRIGLKTFSAGESRTVLGVTDAYNLPSQPGSGYLKTDADELLRFNAAYVSGPYESSAGIDAGGDVELGMRPVEFTATGVPLPESAPTEIPETGTAGPAPSTGADPFSGLPSFDELLRAEPGADSPASGQDAAEPAGQAAEQSGKATPETLLEVVVSRLVGHGTPAHEVWLPPLDVPETVGSLHRLRAAHPEDATARELEAVPAGTLPTLTWPIGLIDRPYEQRRDPLAVDVAGADGNVALVGGPQSGKSTAVRTFVLSAAATHAPEAVQFMCVDLGGGALTSIAGLPHVSGVAGSRDIDKIRRIVGEADMLVAEREERFQALGVESMADYRRMRAEYLSTPPEQRPDSPLASERFGDLFLVIDGWATFRADFEDLSETVASLASRGLSYGVHLMLTSPRWTDIKAKVKDFLGTRIELRLGDPAESMAGRRVGEIVPPGRPGRGITASGHHTLVALPRLDDDRRADTLGSGVRSAVGVMTELYGARAAAPVRMLAGDIPRQALLAEIEQAGATFRPTDALIGVGESALQPIVLDFSTKQHFLAYADLGAGKTTLMRNIVESIIANGSPEQSKIVLLDYRRTMLGVVPPDHLAAYVSSGQAAQQLIPQLVPYFQNRLPGEDVTPKQLMERSWWSGPEIYVVVDDYDLVAPSPSSDPLQPLLQFLPQAQDVGLHLIIVRRIGGASRATFNGTLARLKEMSVDTLIMSGSREESGLVDKYKPRPLPPGRGALFTRERGMEMVQICSVPPLA